MPRDIEGNEYSEERARLRGDGTDMIQTVTVRDAAGNRVPVLDDDGIELLAVATGENWDPTGGAVEDVGRPSDRVLARVAAAEPLPADLSHVDALIELHERAGDLRTTYDQIEEHVGGLSKLPASHVERGAEIEAAARKGR